MKPDQNWTSNIDTGGMQHHLQALHTAASAEDNMMCMDDRSVSDHVI